MCAQEAGYRLTGYCENDQPGIGKYHCECKNANFFGEKKWEVKVIYNIMVHIKDTYKYFWVIYLYMIIYDHQWHELDFFVLTGNIK